MGDEQSTEQGHDLLGLRRLAVQKISEDSIKRLGMEDRIRFGGFYYDDSNERARGGISFTVSFNERNILSMNDLEIQRWSWHEVQHGMTILEGMVANTKEEGESNVLFILGDEFDELRKRMRNHFEKYQRAEYPFLRKVKKRPDNMDDISTVEGNRDYASYDETMSLLRGYQCYLEQLKSGGDISTDPAEFIEAFRPEDLKFLDQQYRRELSKQVREARPEVIRPTDEWDWT